MDPFADGDIVINLTPENNGEDAVVVKREVSLSDVAADNIEIPEGLIGGTAAEPATVTETNGNVTTVTKATGEKTVVTVEETTERSLSPHQTKNRHNS